MLKKKRDPSVDARLARLTAQPAVEFKKMAPKKKRIERGSERRSVYKFCVLTTRNNRKINCIVRDISTGGARLALNGAEMLPDTFKLAIDGYGSPTQARLVWQFENDAGIAFI